MDHHLDQAGLPCTQHSPAAQDLMLAFAAVGARMPGFHHDAASKLQSLMMAIDELGELLEAAGGDVHQALETANVSLRELHQLFTANRALGKPPVSASILVQDLLERASARAGVRLTGDQPPSKLAIEASFPAMLHAFASLLEVIGGPSQLGRGVTVKLAVADAQLELALAGPASTETGSDAHLSETFAIAAFLIARDGGELRCGGASPRFIIRLPVAT